jgi:hypothetical protein
MQENANTNTEETPAQNTIVYADAFAEAFNEEITNYNTTMAPPRNNPNLSPIRTTLNPYNKKQNHFSFSSDFTSQELEELDSITCKEILRHESERLAILDSLRNKPPTAYPNPPTNDNPHPPATNNPTPILHSVTYNTTRHDDTVSILTAQDDSTPSSRPSVTFHPSLISNSHSTVLQKLHTVIIKCFVEAQNEYIAVQNSIMVEAHLTKIAARQRTEQSAEETAIILHSEKTAPTRTIGIAIDNRIQKNRKELEQRLKAVEQQLEQAKNRNAAIARRLDAAPTQNRQPVKDTRALTAGTATKKTAPTKTHPLHQQQRWVPPQQNPTTTASPAIAARASPPNRTAPGYAPSHDKQWPKPKAWPTRRRK